MLMTNQLAGGTVQETTDSRTTLERFRRLGLYVILQHNDHNNIHESMPYEKMLAYAKAHEDDLNFDGLIIKEEEYGGFTVRKPKELTVKEQEFDKEIQEKRALWDGSGWDELKAVAFANNLNIERMQEPEVIMTFVDAGIKREAFKDDEFSPSNLKYQDLVKYAKGLGVEAQGMKKLDILEALAA